MRPKGGLQPANNWPLTPSTVLISIATLTALPLTADHQLASGERRLTMNRQALNLRPVSAPSPYAVIKRRTQRPSPKGFYIGRSTSLLNPLKLKRWLRVWKKLTGRTGESHLATGVHPVTLSRFQV